MTKKIQTIEVIAKDYYGNECLADRCNMGNQPVVRKTPHGYVEIYEVEENGKKKLVGKSNLVLYHGREMLAQRLVNISNNPNVTPTKDEFITWFGLGNGGVILGDPLNPSPPVLTDTQLTSEMMITATDSSAADYHVLTEPGYDKTGYYKIPFDEVEFEQDELNDDKWLILKIQITVGSAYANGEQISEAGLFSAESALGGYTGQFSLFARVTFPSIVKTADRRLIFSWYLYV